MDARTGTVKGMVALLREMGEVDFEQFGKEIDTANLSPARQKQLADTGSTRVGRNEPCPCGSSKKFKKCCLVKDFIKGGK